MTIEELKNVIKESLERLNETVESAILCEIENGIYLAKDEVLQFEVCPTYYRIHLIQTENDILEEFFLDSQIEEDAEESGIDIFDIQNEEILIWFSNRWNKINGPNIFKPAYIYFHGGLYQDRYNLENKTWVKAEEL